MAIQAVFTGDIVNSTKLGAAKEKKLIGVLQQLLSPDKYEFYRGDSFQACLKKPHYALVTVLLCRTAAISISHEETVWFDVRISIGIGQIKLPVRNLSTAKGEAFVLSDRSFDDMVKKENRLAVSCGNTLANEGLQVIADYINAIFSVMTGKQAAVIFELLKGQTQLAVAAKLKKSKSTISQHVSAGRWPEIAKLLQQYENIINQLT